MTILGFESLHWGGPPVRRKVEDALATGRTAARRTSTRASTPSPTSCRCPTNFAGSTSSTPAADSSSPSAPSTSGSTVGAATSSTECARREAGEYDGDFLDVDEAAWRAEWDEHVDAVRAYFAGRDDFLEIDLTANPDWRPLCDLLGVPEPALPFPHVNRSQAEPNPR